MSGASQPVGSAASGASQPAEARTRAAEQQQQSNRILRVGKRAWQHLPKITALTGWQDCVEEQVAWFLTHRRVRDKLCSATCIKTEGAGLRLRYPLRVAALLPESRRAWHGTQLYCLAAILHDGRLKDSTPVSGRTLSRGDGTAICGVYLHGDELRYKAMGYSIWVSPWADGLYWRCLLEVAAGASCRVRKGGKKTDQLIYLSSGVVVTAVIIEIRVRGELGQGFYVYPAWDPQAEMRHVGFAVSGASQPAGSAASGASQPAENMVRVKKRVKVRRKSEKTSS